MTLRPIVVEDRRFLQASADPADLAGVRLHRHAVLVIIGAGADGKLRVTRTLGEVWVPSDDWRPERNDESGSVLHALASYHVARRKLRPDEVFALRVQPLPQ